MKAKWRVEINEMKITSAYRKCRNGRMKISIEMAKEIIEEKQKKKISKNGAKIKISFGEKKKRKKSEIIESSRKS